MFKIVAVAINTFREAVRDRVLYGLIGVSLFILILTLALAELSLHQQHRIVMDIGLASISFFSVMVSIFLGSSLLYKEIERKTLYVVLPKPIRRHEFFLGKFFGIILTVSIFIAIMGAVQLWVVAVQSGISPSWSASSAVGLLILLGFSLYRANDRTFVLIWWSFVALSICAFVASRSAVSLFPILAALGLVLGEVLVVTSIALFFSSFSTPYLTALFTLGVWVVGRSADTMATMKSKILGAQIREMLKWMANVVPNLNLYVPGHHTLETQITKTVGPMSYLLTSLGYSLFYSAFILIVSILIFRRRDLL